MKPMLSILYLTGSEPAATQARKRNGSGVERTRRMPIALFTYVTGIAVLAAIATLGADWRSARHAAATSPANVLEGTYTGIYGGGPLQGNGTSPHGNLGTANATTGWLQLHTAIASWQGGATPKGSAVLGMYDYWFNDTSDYSALVLTLESVWSQAHAVPILHLGSSGFSNAQIRDGTFNSQIDGLAKAFNDWLSPGVDLVSDSTQHVTQVHGADGNIRQLYLRYDAEANGNWYTYSPAYSAQRCVGSVCNGGPPTCDQYWTNVQDFKGASQNIHDRFTNYNGGLNYLKHAPGGPGTATRLQWVFSMNATDGAPATLEQSRGGTCHNRAVEPVTEDIYPGNAYVDWVGIDGYRRFDCGSTEAEEDLSTPGACYCPPTSSIPACMFHDMARRLAALALALSQA